VGQDGINHTLTDRLLFAAARREIADLLNATAEDSDAVASRWRNRWQGLRSWFIGAGAHSSHAETLRARALSAIPALLTAVANINDRRVTRIDRANDLRTLASLVDMATSLCERVIVPMRLVLIQRDYPVMKAALQACDEGHQMDHIQWQTVFRMNIHQAFTHALVVRVRVQ
jgi:hypothetical protein